MTNMSLWFIYQSQFYSKAHFSTLARGKRFLIALIDWDQIWDQFFKALENKNLVISWRYYLKVAIIVAAIKIDVCILWHSMQQASKEKLLLQL